MDEKEFDEEGIEVDELEEDDDFED